MRTLAIRFLFYPTLLWNMLLCRLLARRRWYDRVDSFVILGALPFAHHVDDLVREGVGAVVNTCAEYDGPVAAYARAGIEQLHIPTVDFSPPTRADVDKALAFMRAHVGRGAAVYVHCKAGRGRSATVVACWLIAEKGMTPTAAQAYLLEKRPHVNRGLAERAVLRAIHREAVLGEQVC